MDIEIKETENQINLIIDEMEKGKKNIEMKEKMIAGCEDKIKDISVKLDKLIFQLINE